PTHSRHHCELHMHAFMVFTANYGTYHFILARFVRSGEEELLLTWLEQQVPSFHSGSILGSQQGEAMYRSVAIPRFTPVRGYPQEHLLACLDRDFRGMQPSHLIAAVSISSNLNDMRLSNGGGSRNRDKDTEGDPCQHTISSERICHRLRPV